MSPQGLAWDTVYTGQGIRFQITAPGATFSQPVRAEAFAVTPTGARYAVSADIRTENAEMVLPVEVLAPGLYQVTWSLGTPAGKTLLTGSKAITLQPFANDRALAQETCRQLRAVADELADHLPDTCAALRREARALEAEAHEVEPLQSQALAAPTARQAALEQTASMVRRALRLRRLAQLLAAGRNLPPRASTIAFQAPIWENLGVSDLVPATLEPPALASRLVPGEHEPVVLNIFNITDRELYVRPVVEAPQGMRVRLLRAQAVPTSAGLEAWDALPELDNTAIMTVPSLANRQLWLDVATGSAAPGRHLLRVRLQALNGAGVLGGGPAEMAVAPPETVVEAELTVLPFTMAPSSSFRLCTWAMVDNSPYKDIAEATYRDLYEHGNNVFFSPYGEAQYDAQGNLIGPVDYTRLDAAVARVKGMDVVLLINGYPALRAAEGKDEFGSVPYRKALKTYLADMIAHLASLGFDTDHWALYPIDEAGGTGWDTINLQAEFGKVIREANPRVKIYADPGGPDPAMMEAIAPYVDIWSPAVNTLRSQPEQVDIMRRAGGILWSYNCSYNNYDKLQTSGRSLKAADIVSEYRVAALYAFRHNLVGGGFWTSIVTNEDAWTRTQLEYPLLYPGAQEPVDSRRWEAVREGIEDFRIVTALRERLAQGLPPETAAQVRRLLEQSLPRYVDNITDEAGMNRLRAEIMACVEAVTQAR